ncbi:MAG: GHKL domain-containing protein [Bacillota bacterium]|nr:GHKL domain-containing protein [Bacillota bacterium]
MEIVIRNPIETEITVEDYRIPTSKKGGNHGLGLLTIRDIIEKYNGESEIYVDDGYFTYIITI